MFKEILTKLAGQQDLTPAEAAGVMRIIMEGKASQAQIGAFLLALHMKGETASEIAAFARVMRDNAITVKPRTGRMLVDTCGTGGTEHRPSTSARHRPLLLQEPAVRLSSTETGV